MHSYDADEMAAVKTLIRLLLKELSYLDLHRLHRPVCHNTYNFMVVVLKPHP